MNLDPFFRTPRLTILRETGKGVNLKIGDGRTLLREWLPEDADQNQIIKAATDEVFFLVLRDLVDILPLLHRGEDYASPYIYIRQRDADAIRRIAFLRGRIPFIPKPQASKLLGDQWKRIKKQVSDKINYPEIFVGNMEKMQVYSCDWLASVCTNLEDRLAIYEHGRLGGTRGFQDDDWIFSQADERGVIINTMPAHHLEKDPIMPQIVKPEPAPAPTNDLPLPDDPTIITGDRKGFSKIDPMAFHEAKRKTPAFKRVLERMESKMDDQVYSIGDEPATRFDYMRYIPWAMMCGKMTLNEICTGVNGTPSIQEIAKWMEFYPDFSRAMVQAEQVQAHVFADQAHEIVMGVRDKEDVPVAKLQSKFLMDRAALQSEKFRPKQVIQTENLNDKNADETKKRLRMLIMGNQGILGEVINVTPTIETHVPAMPSISSYQPIIEQEEAE